MAKHTQTIRQQIDFDSTGTYNENIESIVYRRHPIWRISVFSQYSYKKKKKKRKKKAGKDGHETVSFYLRSQSPTD